jgi:NodT family efflux transporter outer membrane factor (OMF) lipoprotein
LDELALSDAILMKPTMNSISNNRPQVGPALVPWAQFVVMGTLGLSLCGCALHKPPAHVAIVDQALPKATPLPPTWTADHNTEIVTGDWVKSFRDPGLEFVVSEAIANNLDLRQSAARVEEARQNVIVASARLKPLVHVPLSGATTLSTSKDQTEQNQSTTALLEIAWEIDVWGRVRSQRAAAEENYEAVALDYAFARQSLAATTAKSWFLAIETRQLLTLAQQSVDTYQKLLELVNVRRAAGKISDLDVAEASYQLSEARSQLAIAQGLDSEARRTLQVLIGRYPSAEVEVATAIPPLPPLLKPGQPSSLLERRPDIAAAEHQVFAAFRSKEAARLALLPQFTLNIEGGRLSDPLLSVLGLNPWLIHSAIGMVLPIYEGGALRAQVNIATAQQGQSVAHFGSVSLRAFDEVEVALTNEELLAKRLPYIESALHDHSEAVRVADLRYRAGSMDLLSVLQLQEGQIQSQADLIKVRNDQLVNRINLHLALGGSFDSSPADYSQTPSP